MKEKFLSSFKEALQIDGREISIEDKFREYDEWDSLGRLSLIALLDEEFDLQIENKEFEKLISVGDILGAIEKKSSANR